MKLNPNPSQEQLDALQQVLRGEPNVGIVDLDGALVTHHLGVEDSGNPGVLIGAAAISIANETAELYKLYVDPTHRHRGVGKLLVKEVFQLIRRHGIDAVDVEAVGQSAPFWNSVTADLDKNFYGDTKATIFIGTLS